MTNTHRIGVQGCGVISAQYFEGLARHPELEVVWATDVRTDLARSMAARFNIPRVGSPADMLADPDIELVVNLTWPGVHYDVSMAALDAGKHVFSEKVIAATVDQAADLIRTASSKNLRIGSAPETFLGSWGSTSRAIVDSGMVGDIIGGVAFVKHNFLEFGHPNPTFLFEDGAGAALDRGPYYVAALINLLGPVAEVAGMTRWGPKERIMRHAGAEVERIAVKIPTHWTGTLRFASGPVITVVFSSDIWANSLPEMELYGTAGSISMPNPNYFDGNVRVASIERDAPFRLVRPPLTPRGNYRGRGVADTLTAEHPRANGSLALHTLEVLRAISDASDSGRTVGIASSVDRPEWPELAHIQELAFADTDDGNDG